MKITTNILDIHIDYEKVDRDFVIVEFKSNNEKKPNPKIFDIEDANFISLSYTGGQYAYALMDEDGYRDLLCAKLNETISYKRVDAKYTDYYKTLLRLFINALANYTDELAYNNLTGKFYKFDAKTKNSVKMEELSINYDPVYNITLLNCSACTFKRVDRFDIDNPVYTFGGNNNTLRRCFKHEDIMFIKRANGNKKASKVFLKLTDKSGRARIMYDLLDHLNNGFSDYLNVKFKEYDILESEPSNGVKLEVVTRDLIENYNIAIVNWTKETENKNEILQLKHNLECTLGKKIRIYKNIQKDMFNIVIIHNKDFYIDNQLQDVHNLLPKKIVTQCITIEELSSIINTEDYNKMNASLVTILKELLIKNDIISNNYFSYDDWSAYNFKNNWEFIKCDKDKNNIYKMTINPNGYYLIEKEEINIFNASEFTNYIKDFNEKRNLELIIKDDKGNTNYIERTDTVALPNPLVFGENSMCKKKAVQEVIYPGLFNINYVEIDGINYYNVGKERTNIRFDFQHASHFRRIIKVGNSKNLVKELLKLMSVSFVKYNELTIVPYPVKYLNEFIEMNKK